MLLGFGQEAPAQTWVEIMNTNTPGQFTGEWYKFFAGSQVAKNQKLADRSPFLYQFGAQGGNTHIDQGGDGCTLPFGNPNGSGDPPWWHDDNGADTTGQYKYRDPAVGMRSPRLTKVNGILFKGRMAGSATVAPNLARPFLYEAVFFHQSDCYAAQSEYGFHRNFSKPGQISFYWHANANCSEVPYCRTTNTGGMPVYENSTVPGSVPPLTRLRSTDFGNLQTDHEFELAAWVFLDHDERHKFWVYVKDVTTGIVEFSNKIDPNLDKDGVYVDWYPIQDLVAASGYVSVGTTWRDCGAGCITASNVALTANSVSVHRETCAPYSLNPSNRRLTSGGGSAPVFVQADGCSWTVTSDSPSWLTVQPSSGAGNGSFNVSAPPNTGGARLAKVAAAESSFKVMQDGSPGVQPFTDVLPSSPFFDYVSLMQSHGLTAGCWVNPPLYCPDSTLTRGQMAVFIVAAMDIALGTTGTWQPNPIPYFSDVPPSHSLFRFIQRLKELGSVTGCHEPPAPPRFCPDSTITHREVAVLMVSSWRSANNISRLEYALTPYFTDVPSNDWGFKFIQKMKEMGFWTGCSATTYCPDNPVTRREMSALIMRSILGAP